MTDNTFFEAIASCLQEDPIFGQCYSYGYDEATEYGTMPDWDVSKVTNMKEAFYKEYTWPDGFVGNLYESFNGNLKNWQVDSVTTMERMFYQCSEFDQDISSWAIYNVRNMIEMFKSATQFKGDISSWVNTHGSLTKTSMFVGATRFKARWKCALLSDAPTFSSCTAVSDTWVSAQQLDDASIRSAVKSCLDESPTSGTCSGTRGPMSTWDTSKVLDMSNLFAGYETTFNADLSSWDVSSVTSMAGIFKNCVKFNSDISGWNTDNVQIADEMFVGASSFNYTIRHWYGVSSALWNAIDYNQIEYTDDGSHLFLEGSFFYQATAFQASHNCSRWGSTIATPNDCYSNYEMSYIRRIDLLPQPTSITCDDGRKNANVYCQAKSCPIPDGLMPTNGNSSGTCEWYMNDYGLCGSDGCSCEPTCLPGYILASEDGTKYEGYTCRLGVLSEPVCRRATFADTDDVKRQGESQLDSFRGVTMKI